MKKVHVISKTIPNDRLNTLASECDLLIFNDNPAGKDDVINRIGDAEIIVTNAHAVIDEHLLTQCAKLKHICTCTAGINHIDLEACKSRNINVKWHQGYCARTLAEKSFAFILMAMNHILPAIDNVRDGGWNYMGYEGRELPGKKLGIFGMGSSGKILANFAKTFGMEVRGTNSKTSDKETNEILSESDVISLNMPLTEQTKHFLNEERLALLKSDIVIVNIARGLLIDEKALISFLCNNPKAVATLDVLAVEPPEQNNELFRLPNVIITPHMAWNTKESQELLQNRLLNDVKEAINQG
jgi:phosphoglycerate dehydrogenase-like enzyme